MSDQHVLLWRVEQIDLESPPDPIHEWASPYCRQFWLPTLGPTTFLLGQWLNRFLHTSPKAIAPIQIPAQDLGVGVKLLRQSLERLDGHRLIQLRRDTVLVPYGVPSVTSRALDRLPPRFGMQHSRDGWVCSPPIETTNRKG